MKARPHEAPLSTIETAGFFRWHWLLWIAVAVALAVWVHVGQTGWDAVIYRSAVQSAAAGHDPYADAMALQVATHARGGVPAGTDPPYSYVYPPATLPLLRLAAHLPHGAVAVAYWLLYGTAVLAQLWVAWRAARTQERRWLLLLAPVLPFFPGLLANGILMSGNIAYILYAIMLAGAALGWYGRSRSRTWLPFYAAVLLASFFKAPLLSMVVLAPLSARRQWMPAALTAVLGAGLFLAQPLLWPGLFRNYLQAVDLQFRFNGDFGCSPAGLFSSLLYKHHLAYAAEGLVLYVGYAVPVLLVLFTLSRRFLSGQFTLAEWMPVLLVGTVLLNPRLIEYDVAPLTLPLLLIGWRLVHAARSRRRATWLALGLLLLLNGAGLYSWSARKTLDGALLAGLFVAGCLHLLRSGQTRRYAGDRYAMADLPEADLHLLNE